MTMQTIILFCVFAYFGIGGLIAAAVTVTSVGFTGRFEPMAIALFFFWPVFYLLQIPCIALLLGVLAGAAAMTWLASYVIAALAS